MLRDMDYGSSLEAEYQPSGAVPPGRLLLGVLACLLAGVVIGTLYTLAVFYLPYMKLRFVATFGAGFALGGILLGILHVAHVRGRIIALFLAAILCISAYYISWVTWMALVLRAGGLGWIEGSLLLLPRPHMIMEIAAAIYAEGYWTHGRDGSPVAGLLLGFIWPVEAGMLLGIPLVMAWRAVAKRPFCERCGSWCTAPKAVASLADTDTEALRHALLMGDLKALLKTGPADFEAPSRLRVERSDCPGCGGLRCMSVWHVNCVAKDGQIVEQLAPVVRHLMLDEAQAKWVDNDLAAAAPTSPPEEPPEEPQASDQLEESDEADDGEPVVTAGGGETSAISAASRS